MEEVFKIWAAKIISSMLVGVSKAERIGLPNFQRSEILGSFLSLFYLTNIRRETKSEIGWCDPWMKWRRVAYWQSYIFTHVGGHFA